MKKQSISKVEQLNNLKQQVIDLKVANKDKAETIKAMKQELLEYNQLRDRFKVLYDENQKLKKALDKACKMLDWDCPVSQDLIADLDCENRCSTDFEECCRECWKIYFLKEVLKDE